VDSKTQIFSATECISAVQGHPRSMIFVPIESAYATSYSSVIVPLVLSIVTVSEIRWLIYWKVRIFRTSLSFGTPTLYVPIGISARN